MPHQPTLSGLALFTEHSIDLLVQTDTHHFRYASARILEDELYEIEEPIWDISIYPDRLCKSNYSNFEQMFNELSLDPIEEDELPLETPVQSIIEFILMKIIGYSIPIRVFNRGDFEYQEYFKHFNSFVFGEMTDPSIYESASKMGEIT